MPPDVASLSLGELRRRYLESGKAVGPSILARLAADPRKGVRQLGRTLHRRRRLRLLEGRRVSAMLRFERGLWRSGLRYVAGVDEAGVGPLAGPVVAAAVVFPKGVFIRGVDDSKRLDPDLRVKLAEEVRRRAVAVSVGLAEVGEIDRINVYQAGLLAMKRAVEGLAVAPERLLVDARDIPGLEIPQDAVVGGDRRHFSIAAASIIAKTARDQMMEELDREFPQYGFASHKGYCTPEHQEAIRRHGCCPIHRVSYDFVRELGGIASPEFYELKERLSASRSFEDLALAQLRMEACRPVLTAGEWRRLEKLRSEKKDALPRPRQLSLCGEPL